MHSKTLKIIATSGFLTALECTKFVFGRGSAPDPAGGAHDAPPDPLVGWGALVGWGGGMGRRIPPLHSPPRLRLRLRRSIVDPPAVLIPPQCLGVWIKQVAVLMLTADVRRLI